MYVQTDLRVCWSHIPHCWKSHALAQYYAVLVQLDNKERVVVYASHSLKTSEKSYWVHTLEYLALIWAICEKFRDYLKGSKFRLLTDNPLTYVLTTAKLDATGQRWLTSLCDYDKKCV